ncbi:hypothetical protein GCM10027053_15170 [Intrasporangium mesophilum]
MGPLEPEAHHESDAHVHRGPITKQSFRLVRWAAVESVQRVGPHTEVGELGERFAAATTSVPPRPPAARSSTPTAHCGSGTSAPGTRALLDFLGVPRHTDIIAGFGLASFPLKGTRPITPVHERLALHIGEAAGIGLLEPPIPRLQPSTEIVIWTSRTDKDPGHAWLRRLLELADLQRVDHPLS